MTTVITTIAGTDLITDSREVINDNFSSLNTNKIETSTLDTDTTLSANSDSKIATQKAVKAYVDAGGNVNASEVQKGIVEEATDAEVTAGTATGATGAKLFVTPAKLLTNNQDKVLTTTVSLSSAQILAIKDTPVELIPAPGANKLIVIDNMVARITAGTPYTASQVIYFPYNGESTTYNVPSLTTTFIQSNANLTYSLIPVGTTPDGRISIEVGVGKSIVATSAANPTDGTGTMKFYIKYRIISL